MLPNLNGVSEIARPQLKLTRIEPEQHLQGLVKGGEHGVTNHQHSILEICSLVDVPDLSVLHLAAAFITEATLWCHSPAPALQHCLKSFN